MSARLSIRIPQTLQEGMERVVKSTGKSESEIVRAALEEFCERHEQERSCYDLAADSGALGCGRGPSDLSVNPKHMEGFGGG